MNLTVFLKNKFVFEKDAEIKEEKMTKFKTEIAPNILVNLIKEKQNISFYDYLCRKILKLL